jgi:hypothetical protein
MSFVASFGNPIHRPLLVYTGLDPAHSSTFGNSAQQLEYKLSLHPETIQILKIRKNHPC